MNQPSKPKQPASPSEEPFSVAEPSSTGPVEQPHIAQPGGHFETVLESDEEIRRVLASDRELAKPIRPAETARPADARSSVPFRPMARPPVALLTVFDDGRTDGEIIRIRDQRFVIGRTEGDLRIPIDGRISSRHVSIVYQVVGGIHRFVVSDLQSMHGMFVRVGKTALADNAEFLVGNGRYRFEMPRAPTAETIVPGADAVSFDSTRGLDGGSNVVRPAALTELIGSEIGNRTLLTKNEYWIGSDPACLICRSDDPTCEPRHVRLYRKENGSWNAVHNKTMNGLWLRMPQVVVESVAQFQIGEQRFQLKVK
jgi:hypothetical protein